MYARDVVQSVLDDQASVLYWQRSDSRTASAFIEKQSAWEKAKHSASTFLYSRGLGHGPERPDQIRDVEVVVAETNQWLEHKIRWSGDAITVAMRLGTGDGEQILGINQQLAAQGPLAKESAVLEAKKFVATLHKEDQVRLPASAREGHVVVLKSQAKEDGAAQFRYQVVDTSPDVQPIVVIGADGRIVWVAQYATVRGK